MIARTLVSLRRGASGRLAGAVALAAVIVPSGGCGGRAIAEMTGGPATGPSDAAGASSAASASAGGQAASGGEGAGLQEDAQPQDQSAPTTVADASIDDATRDAGGGGDEEDDAWVGSGQCNDVVASAFLTPQATLASPAETWAGGTIETGTYVATSLVLYDAPSAVEDGGIWDCGLSDEWAASWVVSATTAASGTIQIAVESAIALGDLMPRYTVNYTTSGSQLIESMECGSCSSNTPYAACGVSTSDASTSLSYTATSAQLVVEFANGPDPDCGEEVLVLTKQ